MTTNEQYLEDIIHDVESMYVTADESEVNNYLFALKLLRGFRRSELLKGLKDVEQEKN